MEYVTKNLEETAEIAKGFASGLKSGGITATVVGLYGELGSGKTTFMKYLAENLGVRETIQSPTFVIMKKYTLTSCFEHLIHVDAYRIEKEEEMVVLGWKQLISDPKNLICIEWPEKISGILPDHIKIFFEHISENERKIRLDFS